MNKKDKILIIDDNPRILNMLKRRLEKLGYELLLANSGQEASTILELKQVDLILLDYMMPEVSGYDFFLELKSRKEVPVVMMTAHSSLNLAIEFLKNGGADFVEKPLDIDILDLKMRKALGLSKRLQAEKMARLKAEAELQAAHAHLLEKNRQLEAKNEQLEAFGASISHELRAPLRHITNFIYLLQKNNYLLDNEESRAMIKIINEACNQADELIQSLLDFSRMSNQHLHIDWVDCEKMVKELIDQRKQADAAEVSFETGSLPRLKADRVLLQQVFANLIDNAIKYASPATTPIVKIDAVEADDAYLFSVADNGVGFDPAYREEVFKLFRRVHSSEEFEGTGVGLATVKNIIEKHGGKVWVDSMPGAGATFYFTLPKERSE